MKEIHKAFFFFLSYISKIPFWEVGRHFLNLKETIKTHPPKPYCTVRKQMALAMLCWKAAFNYQSGYYQQMGTHETKPNSRRGRIWLLESTCKLAGSCCVHVYTFISSGKWDRACCQYCTPVYCVLILSCLHLETVYEITISMRTKGQL